MKHHENILSEITRVVLTGWINDSNQHTPLGTMPRNKEGFKQAFKCLLCCGLAFGYSVLEKCRQTQATFRQKCHEFCWSELVCCQAWNTMLECKKHGVDVVYCSSVGNDTARTNKRPGWRNTTRIRAMVVEHSCFYWLKIHFTSPARFMVAHNRFPEHLWMFPKAQVPPSFFV